MNAATASISAGTAASPAVQRTRELIIEGRSMLEERQKLIRLADCSKFGWGVVDKYTTDDLAKDFDDKKRIERAERAAGKKAAKHHKMFNPAKVRGGHSRLLTPSPQTPAMGVSVVVARFDQLRQWWCPQCPGLLGHVTSVARWVISTYTAWPGQQQRIRSGIFSS